MARESGGGGALGWTLLGFLAGIAATLGVQTLILGASRPSEADEAVSSQVHITKTAPTVAPLKPKKKAEALAATSSSPPPAAPSQPSAEVEDDAAAAGMTSRVSAAPANNN